MSTLALLLSVLYAPVVVNDVAISFEYIQTTPGKPTLNYYRYKVTLQNKSTETKYVVLPNWFNDSIPLAGIVDGSGTDSYDKITEYKLYGKSTITILKLNPKSKVVLKAYSISTFDEEIPKKSIITIPVIVCKNVWIDGLSLEDYFKASKTEPDEEDDYTLEGAVEGQLTIDVAHN